MPLLTGTTLLLTLLSLSQAIETVSIHNNTLETGHDCISKCLFRTRLAGQDMGDAMQCGQPYDNHCYCATAPESVSKASSWLDACASKVCRLGDRELDLSTMKSVYAGYCLDAGYTQMGISGWFDAGRTTSSQDAVRTENPEGIESDMNLTIVTKTTVSSSRGVRVTIQSTSTVYFNEDSAREVDQSQYSSASSLALGIGLGIGIPLTLSIFGAILMLFWRRKRKPSGTESAMDETDSKYRSPSLSSQTSDTPGSTISEMSAERFKREVDIGEINQFQEVSPVSGISVPGQHELDWTPRVAELPGSGPDEGYYRQTGTSHQYHTQDGAHSPRPRSDFSWELPTTEPS